MAVSPEAVLAVLRAAGVDFYTGVPDSLLQELCACVAARVPADRHVIAANEGAAVALAAGHHLGTGGLGLVYMQNSGLGNAVNPLVSLADPAVYGIPMLLLVGWRGEPGRRDEPQHEKQGAITLPLLAAMGIESAVLPEEEPEALAVLRGCVDEACERSAPVCVVVRAGTLAAAGGSFGTSPSLYPLTREEAVAIVADRLPADAAMVSTTGMASRELYEHRVAHGQPAGWDFLTVGSMGHASQIALGIALSRPERLVCCLDGDGAVIMHMGSLALIGSRRPSRFVHVVLNNGVHDSVGGQPTIGFEIDLPAIARACGYPRAARVETADDLRAALRDVSGGPFLLEVRVRPGARADLGRPATTPQENKRAFRRRF